MFNFKDKSPKESISNAKKLMDNLGIKVREIWYESNIVGLYSVRLLIRNAYKYGVNGKGISKEYALASAYGELVERLGNGILLKNKELYFTDGPFTYFPDEYEIEARKLDIKTNEIIKSLIKKIGATSAVSWSRLCDAYNFDFVKCIRFKSNINEQIQLDVPLTLLKSYGSNGMACGNTYEEAFVQSFSEIVERYCLKEILAKKICPPIIPLSNIKQLSNSLSNSVEKIKKNKLKIEFRDCSLGRGFPVVCVCIYDKKKHSNIINFGAHPCIEVALERALTEAFQGKNIDNVTFPINLQNTNERYNKFNIIKNGIGSYPYNFYSKKFSYKFSSIKPRKFDSNIELKSYIINFCKEKQINIYSHGIKLGDFYCIHLIIPGMSEIFEYDELMLRNIQMRSALSRIEYLDVGDETQQRLILEYIDYIRKNPDFGGNLSKNIDDKSVRQDSNNREYVYLKILIRGFFRLGEYDRVLYYLERTKPFMKLDINLCLRILTDIKKYGSGNEDAINITKNFFSNSIIKQSLEFLKEKETNPFFYSYSSKDNSSCFCKWLNSVVLLKRNMIPL